MSLFISIPDIAKIKETASTFGYFLLIGNDNESSGEELLHHYRTKNADEKLFIVVNLYGRKKTRTHNNATTEDKIFFIFIALIMKNEMFRRMEKYSSIHNISLKKQYKT